MDPTLVAGQTLADDLISTADDLISTADDATLTADRRLISTTVVRPGCPTSGPISAPTTLSTIRGLVSRTAANEATASTGASRPVARNRFYETPFMPIFFGQVYFM
jgi:hypothetical protein